MLDSALTLALIPARGGSKGLPHKNLLDFAGKPLIAWSIEAALASQACDRVVVSTDDPEIAEIGRAYGAEVPFLRPAEFAQDASPTIDMIAHAIGWLREHEGVIFDVLALVEPTSPLREPSDIDGCVARLLGTPGAESVVTVAPAESAHPVFTVVLDEAGHLAPYVDADFRVLRRQELEPAYYFDGTMYAAKVGPLLERRTFYHDATYGFVVPRWKAIEIDDMYDFVAAQAIMRHRMGEVAR